MLLVGIQGSPRKNGNTNYLLSIFIENAKKLGVETHVINVNEKKILPCVEYSVCEKKGFCPIEDDMNFEIYQLISRADVIVVASPLFFCNVPGQLKCLIDRCQVFWARRYRLNLNSPMVKYKRGFLLALGARRRKDLFDGIKLTTNFFFDAIGANFSGVLTYNQIENLGDMQKHISILDDVKKEVNNLLSPLINRKKVLLVGVSNDCRSQMAHAFTQLHAGDKLEVYSAGLEPSKKIDLNMEIAMREKGIDMAYRTPFSYHEIINKVREFDYIVTMDNNLQKILRSTDKNIQSFNLSGSFENSLNNICKLRDEIENNIRKFIQNNTTKDYPV